MEFSYQPLTPEPSRQFRLLKVDPGAELAPIQTTLRHVNLQNKLEYNALSYQWDPKRSTSNEEHEIFVNNKSFKILDNLWRFLNIFRASKHSPQEIYIDAICINQPDIEEKEGQVALMSEIYKLAKKVLVWLGPHEQNSEMVFGANPLSRMFKSRSNKAAAWEALLERPYWNRTWIIQEFLLARKVVIFCGPDQMEGDSIFTKPLQSHYRSIMQKNNRKKRGFDRIPRSFLLYVYKQKQKRSLIFSDKLYFADTDIFEIAFSFQYTCCKNIQDHVFGLLALEDPKKVPRINPKYISAQNLFIDICMSRLPTATKGVNMVTDDRVIRVVQLFRGLRLTFDNAEEILDIMFDSNQSQTQNRIVIATIAAAFDQFGLLKPERKQWILPQTEAPPEPGQIISAMRRWQRALRPERNQSILPQTKASPEPEQIISAMRKWQIAQKKRGNWYPTAQKHHPEGMTFHKLDEPLWSQYSILKAIDAREMARRGTMVNMSVFNNINMMNNLIMTNQAMMGGAGVGGMGA